MLWSVPVTKRLIVQSSPVSRHFLLGPNIPLSILFLNILNPCSSFSLKDQVSHPYKTAYQKCFLQMLTIYLVRYHRLHKGVCSGPSSHNDKHLFKEHQWKVLHIYRSTGETGLLEWSAWDSSAHLTLNTKMLCFSGTELQNSVLNMKTISKTRLRIRDGFEPYSSVV
jgi:hypothetical protein